MIEDEIELTARVRTNDDETQGEMIIALDMHEWKFNVDSAPDGTIFIQFWEDSQ